MNLLPLALLGTAALLLARQSQADGPMVQGQSYVAVFEIPPGITQEQIASVMPADATVQLDGSRAVITFTAPRSANITDVPTPLGTLKILSVRRMSEVVGAITDSFAPTYATFSGWYKDERGNYKWSGWTKPMVMSRAEVNHYMIVTPWYPATAYRWDGKQWVKA